MENLLSSKNDLALLTQHQSYPCLSLYVPLARGGNSKGDELKLEQLKRQAENILNKEGLTADRTSEMVLPIENLLEDGIRSLKGEKVVGLAFFVNSDVQKTYLASHPTPERVVIDDHFDLRPLVKLLPLEDEFHVLTINRNNAILFRGSQGSLVPVFLPLGVSGELNIGVTPYVFPPHPEPGESESSATSNLFNTLHATSPLERDFKYVDEYVRSICHDIDKYLAGKKSPLILASTEVMKPIIEKHLKYQHVASEEIRTPTAPDRTQTAALYKQAQKILERHDQEEKRKELARYREIADTRYSATAIADILQAALMGQIDLLLASAQKNIYGRYDRDTGEVQIHPKRHTMDTELVSLAVQEALNHDARVHLVDDTELSQDSPLAAILRW